MNMTLLSAVGYDGKWGYFEGQETGRGYKSFSLRSYNLVSVEKHGPVSFAVELGQKEMRQLRLKDRDTYQEIQYVPLIHNESSLPITPKNLQ
jgi:hypothetical protein